jgi:hypothetical protein
MTKIRNIFNNGKANGAKLGVVNVNSFNVCPDTITADATPATVTRAQLNQYDFFKVQQDTANTDEFDLPADAEVGDSFVIYALDAFEVRTESETAEINGAASAGFTTVAKSMYQCTKVPATGSVDEWRVVAIAENGSVTTLTVNVAA